MKRTLERREHREHLIIRPPTIMDLTQMKPTASFRNRVSAVIRVYHTAGNVIEPNGARSRLQRVVDAFFSRPSARFATDRC